VVNKSCRNLLTQQLMHWGIIITKPSPVGLQLPYTSQEGPLHTTTGSPPNPALQEAVQELPEGVDSAQLQDPFVMFGGGVVQSVWTHGSMHHTALMSDNIQSHRHSLGQDVSRLASHLMVQFYCLSLRHRCMYLSGSLSAQHALPYVPEWTTVKVDIQRSMQMHVCMLHAFLLDLASNNMPD